MEPEMPDVQGSQGVSRSGYQDDSLRARARAVELTIRIVLDGFTLGRPGGPRERFNTIEELAARLDEIEIGS
jgi:hypothetical protein